jgi:hypothetical protein
MIELIVILMGAVIGAMGHYIYVAVSNCSPKANTQAKMVLDHLKKNKTLTSKEAKNLYSIIALRSVVCRLRSAGYEINIERDGHKGIYSMK